MSSGEGGCNRCTIFAGEPLLDRRLQVFVSPHYLYPHDQGWGFGGPIERMMLDTREFFRDSQLAPAGVGAD